MFCGSTHSSGVLKLKNKQYMYTSKYKEHDSSNVGGGGGGVLNKEFYFKLELIYL